MSNGLPRGSNKAPPHTGPLLNQEVHFHSEYHPPLPGAQAYVEMRPQSGYTYLPPMPPTSGAATSGAATSRPATSGTATSGAATSGPPYLQAPPGAGATFQYGQPHVEAYGHRPPVYYVTHPGAYRYEGNGHSLTPQERMSRQEAYAGTSQNVGLYRPAKRPRPKLNANSTNREVSSKRGSGTMFSVLDRTILKAVVGAYCRELHISSTRDLKWEYIADHMPRHSAEHCKNEWENLMSEKRSYSIGSNSSEEDVMSGNFGNDNDKIKRITRTKKRVPWSEEEVKIIHDMQKSVGNKWTKIAEMLNKRTRNDVKNYWYSKQRTLEKREKVLAQAAKIREASKITEENNRSLS